MQAIEIEEIIIKNSKTAPVKLTPILKEIGISLFTTTFKNKEKSGHIEKTTDGYQIVVDKNQSFHRKRFTVAHELAHFILHRDTIDRKSKEESPVASHTSEYVPEDAKTSVKDYFLYRKAEADANYKAAEILMPMNLIQDEMKKIKQQNQQYSEKETMEETAKNFEVSFEALALRLQKVAYIYN